MGKVMLERLSKAARYSEVLCIRHIVCEFAVRRTIPKVDFWMKQKVLWLLEEKIRPTAYRWRIDCDCRRDCVPLEIELVWPLVARYWGFACNRLILRVFAHVIAIRSTLVIFPMHKLIGLLSVYKYCQCYLKPVGL